jgi:hypothetical protein
VGRSWGRPRAASRPGRPARSCSGPPPRWPSHTYR